MFGLPCYLDMKKEIFIVENIKCSGCINTIHSKLSALKNVSDVVIDFENQKIEVSGETIDRESISKSLSAMGYPEAGENNLLHKAKSYVSCAIGRMA